MKTDDLALALSHCSGKALAILIDLKKQSLIAEGHQESNDESLDQLCQRLLSSKNTDFSQLKKIFCVKGPGSFTGLRMSASYCLGLSLSLQIPLIPISSFDLYQKSFYICLRFQKGQILSRKEALAQNFPFLELKSSKSFEIKAPQEDSLCLGLKDHPHWPQSKELLSASLRFKDKESTPFIIEYGFTPQYVKSL